MNWRFRRKEEIPEWEPLLTGKDWEIFDKSEGSEKAEFIFQQARENLADILESLADLDKKLFQVLGIQATSASILIGVSWYLFGTNQADFPVWIGIVAASFSILGIVSVLTGIKTITHKPKGSEPDGYLRPDIIAQDMQDILLGWVNRCQLDINLNRAVNLKKGKMINLGISLLITALVIYTLGIFFSI